MTSKRRIRRTACRGKIHYRTEAAAAAALRSHPKAAQASLHVYRCQFGDHWHIGHLRRQTLVRKGLL